MGRRIILETHSAEETLELGHQIGSNLHHPQILCLKGDLGSGKTTLIQGFIEALTGVCCSDITSPTFGLMHCYSDDLNRKSVRHFDLYRLQSLEEFINLGFEHELDDTYACIEWPEKIEGILPPHHVSIEFLNLGGNQRSITIDADHEEILLESIKLHCRSAKL